jgi:hypothetical protein
LTRFWGNMQLPFDQPIFDDVKFRGVSIEPIDQPRLESQAERVRKLMSDHKWRSLPEIRQAMWDVFKKIDSEAALSARLRDCRRDGYTVDRRRRSGGLFEYRVSR